VQLTIYYITYIMLTSHCLEHIWRLDVRF